MIDKRVLTLWCIYHPMNKPTRESTGNKSVAAQREEEILAFWNEQKIFDKSLAKDAPQGEFVFYDGPPFATGLPHSGTLLSSIAKDVIPRYKTMRGYHVRRRWGWDCHGLPIESLVEKELGLKTKKDILDIGIEKFNETARSFVLRYVDEWKKYIERVGRWVDFDHSYKTMDNTYIESVWWAIKEMHKKGKIYEGRKVLLYCPHCETPLAKAEIAMDNTYQDVTEEAVTVKFEVKNPADHSLPQNTFILAWTTTPWTLPGNVALAVGKDISYVLVEEDDARYLLAKDLYKGTGDIVKEFTGEDLAGLAYTPLYEVQKVQQYEGKKYQVLLADFVSTDEGTGVVHTAVMYGEDDFALGQKEHLPMVQLLDASGKYNTDAPELVRGIYIKDAERLIKKDLEDRGLLFKRENNTHSYPHCYRCGTPLIYNAISSWFIDIQSVKQRMIEENEQINWSPQHLQHGRFGHILETAPDWTISRNRFWASPLPIWKCEQCKEIAVVGSRKELKERANEPVPEDLDLHRPYIDAFTLKCSCGGTMRRIPEVVDCWLESGSMPFAEYHYPFENVEEFEKRFPGDFIAEYIAQTRTWFYYMHALGVLLFNKHAFNNVVTTGNVLAADGSKVSKSKKNYTDPYVLFNTFGADAFRFYLMSSVVMQAEDMMFIDSELRETHNKVVNLLRNTLTFYGLYKENAPEPERASDHILDRWILARLNEALQTTTESFEAYDMVHATRPMRDFIDDFSTWYVRRSRERVKSADAGQALGTMRYVLREFSKIIAPIMPFIAEEIYRTVRTDDDPESVHLTSWPKNTSDMDLAILQDMATTRALVSSALKLRQTAGLKIRQPLSKLSVKNDLLKDKEEYLALIRDEINVKAIVFDASIADEAVLDTTITPELAEEGAVRELIRTIQDLRKKNGLSRNDAAVLVYASDTTLLEKHWEEIRQTSNLLEFKKGQKTAIEKV